MATKKQVQSITENVRKNFRSFGGGYYTQGNPISVAIAEQKPQFAAGVDIEDVVRFVLKENSKL